jgi:S-DNA-T family DNA segregation ATPase FtsK/SpoIIIE
LIELQLTVEPVSGAAVDVSVELESDASVGALAQELAVYCAAGERDTSTALTIGCRRTAQVFRTGVSVADAELRNGDRISLVAVDANSVGESATGEGAPSVDLEVVGGLSSGLRRPLADGRYLLGRDAGCDIVLDDPSLSRRHLAVEVSRAGVAVSDVKSSNGSSVDGVVLADGETRQLLDGQHVEIGRTLIRFRSSSANARRAVPVVDGFAQFNRPPRVARPSRPAIIKVEAPPETPSKVRLPLAAALLPLLMGVAFAVLVHQPAMLLFSALSPVMIGWTYVSDRRTGRKTFASRRAEFKTHLKELEDRLAQEHEAEIATRRAAEPDATELVERATGLAPSLWERRPDDADFLELRLGLADQPTQVVVEMPEAGSIDLLAEAERLTAPFATVPAVPATLPLAGVSAVGLAGPHDRTTGLGRWLAVQAAALHSPSDLVIAAAIAPRHLAEWEWLKWLPHARSASSPLDAGPLAASSLASREMLRSLSALVATRRAEAQERYGPGSRRPRPQVLLLLDEAAATDRASIGEILAASPNLGVTTVWMGRDARDLPGECAFVVELDSEVARLRLTDVRSGAILPDVAVDAVTTGVAGAVARSLAGIRDTGASSGGTDIPRRVSLLELLDLVEPDAGEIAERWARAEGLGAPIGVEAGVPFELDLRRDGPHGLIAGTTGAGKSELLQSLVASLAASHPPDRISFLLIDYKGGAAFKDCARLPHAVGMVTDLDEHLTRRALVSLNAELRRREAVLKRADAKDLTDLEASDPQRAPASLVIVIDEFAALAREVPDFVDGIVDVAQRGRSLGVHLILATQRPSGVVSENIRANTNLRIALRVATPIESDDVIASREAARVPRTLPGRAYARTGHSELTAFQAGYVGGRTRTSAAAKLKDITVRPFALVEPESREPAADGRERVPDAPNDLKRLVGAITAAAVMRGTAPPPSPWLPALAPILPWASLQVGEDVQARGCGTAVLGLIDEPARQRQTPLVLDLEADGHLLIYGASGAGKSALLRTIAVSLAHHGSPDELQIYGLDFASRGLSVLDALPHCGSVVVGEDDERVVRMISLLRRTIDRRREQLANAGVFSLSEYQAIEGSPQTPRIVLLLDSYAGFTSAYERVNGGSLVDALPRLVADGRSVGVHVIITVDRRSAVPPAVANVIARKLVLRMADDDEYAALGLDLRAVRGAKLPPGRGFTGASLEFQAAIVGVDASSEAQSAEITRLGDKLASRYGDRRAPVIQLLPARIDRNSLPVAQGLLRTTVGLTDDELAPLTVDLTQSHFVVAGPYHSGRSTALATLVGGLRDSGDLDLHLLAPRRRSPLVGMTGWRSVAVGTEECVELAAELARLVTARGGATEQTVMVVVIDDAGELADVAGANPLDTVIRRGRDVDVRVLVGIEVQIARSAYAPWIRDIRKDGHGILLDPDLDIDGDVLGVRLPRRSKPVFPPGRGYYVSNGVVQLVQVATGA